MADAKVLKTQTKCLQMAVLRPRTGHHQPGRLGLEKDSAVGECFAILARGRD